MPRGGKREGAGRKPRAGKFAAKPRPAPRPAAPALTIENGAANVMLSLAYIPASHVEMVNARLKGPPLEVVRALGEMPMPTQMTEEQERWERSFRLECQRLALPYVARKLAPAQEGYEQPAGAQDGEQSNDLELARRIAFALAMGAAKAKQAA